MKGNNFTDMEIGKLIVIQEVIDGKKTGKQASDKLDLSEDYCDTNFTHFQELLQERENIKISYSSVYKTLTKSGIKSKKKHKDRKTHRQRKRTFISIILA